MPTRRKYQKLSSLVLALDVFFFCFVLSGGNSALAEGSLWLVNDCTNAINNTFFSNTVY